MEDTFSALMVKVEEQLIIEGFLVSRNNDPFISHLQFANDNMYFLDANLDQVLNLKLVMRIFESILGLKINLSKPSMAGIGVKDRLLSRFADSFGCKVDLWFLKYLGMLLEGNPRSLFFRDPIVERVQKKMEVLYFFGRMYHYDQGSHV